MKFQILVSTCSWAAAQAGSTNCKIVVRVECGTFITLPSRILVVSLKELAYERKRISLISPPVTTAEIRPSRNLAEKTDKKWKFQILVSTCSWAAAQAGSTNCKIVVRVECGTFITLPSRILVVSLKELAYERKRISLISPPVTTAEIRPSRNLAEKTDKKWKFQILVSTCSWAAAQAGSTNCKFAVRVECDTFTTLPSRILVALWNYEQDRVEFRSQSDLSVPGMLCGVRYPREGQSSYKATLSFIMAYKRQYWQTNKFSLYVWPYYSFWNEVFLIQFLKNKSHSFRICVTPAWSSATATTFIVEHVCGERSQ